ncbi:MAG: 50S ribosomal protein L9 [Firmicutes bacterium]|nr:50S ribosomal protein L9 [Bacillota bacterium]
MLVGTPDLRFAMKIVLQKDVPGLGKKENAVEVAEGYARNYLIPRGLAIPASSVALQRIEQAKQAEKRREAREEARARELARALRAQGITIRAKAGGNGKLYGSVTAKDIADGIRSVMKVDIDRRKIDLPESIRATGEYTVGVKLFPGVAADVKIVVVPDKTSS